jgi:ferric-dicitrate binding protein FerR (iron transport regulator)
VNEELLMRALIGRAIDAEVAAVDAWRAASPDHERQFRELQQMLADIAAWYRATPLRPAPPVETLIRRARRVE